MTTGRSGATAPQRGVLGRPTGARGHPPPGRGRRSLGEGKGGKKDGEVLSPTTPPHGPDRPRPEADGRPPGVFKPPRRDALGTWKGGERAFRADGVGNHAPTGAASASAASTPQPANGSRSNLHNAWGAETPRALPARDGAARRTRQRAPPPNHATPRHADQTPSSRPARRTPRRETPRDTRQHASRGGGPPPLPPLPSTTASRPRTRGPGPSPRWGEGLRREAGCRLGHGARRAGRGEAGHQERAGACARAAPTAPRAADERRGADAGGWGALVTGRTGRPTPRAGGGKGPPRPSSRDAPRGG